MFYDNLVRRLFLLYFCNTKCRVLRVEVIVKLSVGKKRVLTYLSVFRRHLLTIESYKYVVLTLHNRILNVVNA